jgi:hypothetical protein
LITDRDNLNTLKETLESEKVSLTEQITKLNAEVANLKEMATVGTNYITSLRESVVASYKKLKGDNADDTIVNMLNANTTGLQTLISLQKDYNSQLEEKFPLTCAKCGSHDVNRASAVEEKEDTNQNKEEDEDVISSLYRSKLK